MQDSIIDASDYKFDQDSIVSSRVAKEEQKVLPTN